MSRCASFVLVLLAAVAAPACQPAKGPPDARGIDAADRTDGRDGADGTDAETCGCVVESVGCGDIRCLDERRYAVQVRVSCEETCGCSPCKGFSCRDGDETGECPPDTRCVQGQQGQADRCSLPGDQGASSMQDCSAYDPGRDGCPDGEACYHGVRCPSASDAGADGGDCEPPVGDRRCHRLCPDGSDCPETETCTTVYLPQGGPEDVRVDICL